MVGIFDISYENIEVIKNLWERNRQYHEEVSEYFSELYSFICFDEKIKNFREFSEDMLKITVAKDNDEYIGYCISTIDKGKGELQALHIDESRRRTGIGKELVALHLGWMKDNNCKIIGVTVSQENESAINFYKKLGFYPNTLYMQQLLKK